MALDKATFEAITPSRFTTFTFPDPRNPHSLLRLAVLDSPSQPPPADSPRVAAMIVPAGRESDWLFSAESGHLHLLLSSPPPRLSRLVLAGAPPGDISRCRFARNAASCDRNGAGLALAESLRPLFLALSPKLCFAGESLPEISVLSYEDGVVSGKVLGVFVGALAGEMLVEDVEIETVEGEGKEREFRRRLRFKRMPNLIQTQVRIVGFRPELRVLVQPYLAPMAASLGLIGGHIGERILAGARPKALCLGVGGGALVMFLAGLGFEVWGVEEDREVLRVGKEFFGLEDGEFVKLFVSDAKEFVQRAGDLEGFEFDVVMVDLDSRDLANGVCAPPVEFWRNCVLSGVRSVLADEGIVVVNVVPQSFSVYEKLKSEFREVFGDLYEIDVGNEENFVLIASVLPGRMVMSECENSFVAKLRMAISGEFMVSIRKI